MSETTNPPPPKWIAPAPRASAALMGSGHSLPPDLIRKSVNRLGWVALMYAVAVFAVYRLGHWLGPPLPDHVPDFLFMDFNVPLAVALGGTVCFLAWSGKLPPLLMLDIGLLFEVMGGLLLSLSETSLLTTMHGPFPGPSSVSVWIVLFVLAVPTTLGKTIIAALATAVMVPAGMAVNVLIQHAAVPPLGYWVLRSFSPLFIAVCAIVLSRFVYELGSQVKNAREMGSYELQDLLGRGGMGEVWRAKHRLLAREAAVKLILPQTLSSFTERQIRILTTRFEREAKATAALRSPHTVTLYDYGVSDLQTFYYAMELLEGLDLWYLVERFGPLPPGRVVYFLRQACDSLAEAHARGLVHRDIKPTNLFTCRLGFHYDFLKVLDFGLVKFALDEAQTQLTAANATTGTPAYMAPESSTGNRRVDARSDIYSLGCVGYWLLTGELVFNEAGALSTALAHVNNPVEPPSQRAGIGIPEPLERLVLQCLEKKPAYRPQSALELSSLLAECDAGEPWTPEKARVWWELNLPEHCQVAPETSNS